MRGDEDHLHAREKDLKAAKKGRRVKRKKREKTRR
jgi:hypothetical protein